MCLLLCTMPRVASICWVQRVLCTVSYMHVLGKLSIPWQVGCLFVRKMPCLWPAVEGGALWYFPGRVWRIRYHSLHNEFNQGSDTCWSQICICSLPYFLDWRLTKGERIQGVRQMVKVQHHDLRKGSVVEDTEYFLRTNHFGFQNPL